MDKLKKNSKLDSEIITKSKYYGKKEIFRYTNKKNGAL